MKNAHQITAKEILEENPVVVSKDSSLTQLKNRMEEENLRAVTVVDGDDFEGVVGYRDLIRFIQFNPESTNLDKVMHQPPEFDMKDSLVDLCDLRINSGRKLLVNTEGDVLKGIIGDEQFLKAFKNVKDLKNISTRDLATYELVVTYDDSKVDKPRHKMLDNNISRLPVLNSEGKLTGKISSTDLLKTMVRRDVQNAGGTSGGRSGREEVNIAGGKEKDSMSEINVSEVMNRTPCISEDHLTGVEAVNKMIKESSHEIFFTEGQYPKSIITNKDFVKHLANLKERETVMVQLTGLDVEEEKEAVHSKIRTQLQGSLGRKLSRPKEITLRVKKHKKDGKKHRYEIDLKLHSEYGVTTINEDGWNLLDILDQALEQLNRVVRDKKEKRSSHN